MSFLCHFVLVFFSPFSIAITSLGEEIANLSAFRTFVRFVLVWICRFSLPLGVWEGLRFVTGTPWTFLWPFFSRLQWVKEYCSKFIVCSDRTKSVNFIDCHVYTNLHKRDAQWSALTVKRPTFNLRFIAIRSCRLTKNIQIFNFFQYYEYPNPSVYKKKLEKSPGITITNFSPS